MVKVTDAVDLSPPTIDSGDVVQLLSNPRSYPERPGKVEIIETHISWVFLIDGFVYKLKKPIRFDFLDYSTPAARKHACDEEVRINRRLAADTYLGVVPIVVDWQGNLRLGGNGKPVDWVVKMRRLPDDQSLDRLILSNQATDTVVERASNRLLRFYQALPPLTVRPEQYRLEIERHVRSNRRELLGTDVSIQTTTVKRVHAAQLRFLAVAGGLFDQRVLDGRIVDGHGDLRPEHIYFTPTPVVIDAIEFSDEFRRLDVLDELSFLAMECEFLNAPSIGRHFVHDYCQASGDRPPPRLFDFYAMYRACVRAKVLALTAQQGTSRARSELIKRIGKYLTVADNHATRSGPPCVFVVRGLMGTGKSTLATALSELLGIELLQTDMIRRELFGANAVDHAFDTGKYRPENRGRVYDEIFRRADTLLREGLSVVLDGTFLSIQSRADAISLAESVKSEIVVVHCHCPDHVAMERIADRISRRESQSEARPELYLQQKANEEPGSIDTSSITVDTTTSVNAMLDVVTSRLRNLYNYR